MFASKKDLKDLLLRIEILEIDKRGRDYESLLNKDYIAGYPVKDIVKALLDYLDLYPASNEFVRLVPRKKEDTP